MLKSSVRSSPDPDAHDSSSILSFPSLLSTSGVCPEMKEDSQSVLDSIDSLPSNSRGESLSLSENLRKLSPRNTICSENTIIFLWHLLPSPLMASTGLYQDASASDLENTSEYATYDPNPEYICQDWTRTDPKFSMQEHLDLSAPSPPPCFQPHDDTSNFVEHNLDYPSSIHRQRSSARRSLPKRLRSTTASAILKLRGQKRPVLRGLEVCAYCNADTALHPRTRCRRHIQSRHHNCQSCAIDFAMRKSLSTHSRANITSSTQNLDLPGSQAKGLARLPACVSLLRCPHNESSTKQICAKRHRVAGCILSLLNITIAFKLFQIDASISMGKAERQGSVVVILLLAYTLTVASVYRIRDQLGDYNQIFFCIAGLSFGAILALGQGGTFARAVMAFMPGWLSSALILSMLWHDTVATSACESQKQLLILPMTYPHEGVVGMDCCVVDSTSEKINEDDLVNLQETSINRNVHEVQESRFTDKGNMTEKCEFHSEQV